MKRNFLPLVASSLFFTLAMTLAGLATPLGQQDVPASAAPLGYHDHPPWEILPTTLDPQQFKEDQPAFVAYSLAAQIKETLYQVPCYCPCRKRLGHESLLDCYVSRHGVKCPTCQQEVLFCYAQHKKGKTPAQIREALAQGQARKLDIDKTTHHLFKHLVKTKPEKK